MVPVLGATMDYQSHDSGETLTVEVSNLNNNAHLQFQTGTGTSRLQQFNEVYLDKQFGGTHPAMTKHGFEKRRVGRVRKGEWRLYGRGDTS